MTIKIYNGQFIVSGALSGKYAKLMYQLCSPLIINNTVNIVSPRGKERKENEYSGKTW